MIVISTVVSQSDSVSHPKTLKTIICYSYCDEMNQI